MDQQNRTMIVIGCGTPGAGDDAAGLEVVAELTKLDDPGCELRRFEGAPPPEFLSDIPPGALVIYVDAVETQTSPGNLHCVKLPSASARPRHLPMEVLVREVEDVRMRSGSVPRLFLLGIEIAELKTGSGLSGKAQKAVKDIVNNFARYRKLAENMT